MAEGLDAIFAKHMKTGTGKYLVFCANIEHLDEMIEKAPEWFRKVDRAPHIYRAYSDDPGTSKAFAAFKADHSDHEQYAEVKRFFEENGHLNVPAGYRSSSSKDLDAWIDRQLSAKVKAKLSDSQKKQLEAIGFQW